jgi:hypothetical protein
MAKGASTLKERVVVLEQENRLLRSLLDSFWQGEAPCGASLTHHLLAQWGRRRLEEKKKKPALLGEQ